MPYNYNKLRGRIIEKYQSMANFATAMGVSRQYVYKKMSGETAFSRAGIEKWADLLDIAPAEYAEYFFA